MALEDALRAAHATPRKKGKDSPREQLVRELALRGLPAPVAIEPCDGAALFDPGAGEAAKTRWLAFRMRRLRDRGKDGVATAGFGGFEIEFAEKQRGPILLGYGAHDGLGQFEAVREENDGEPGPMEPPAYAGGDVATTTAILPVAEL